MKKRRVYVAVPLTHKRDRKQAQIICQYLRAKNLEVTSPWVAEEDAKQCLTAQKVYDRDVFAVAGSDAVVAEVSEPSLGIGMELMVALSEDIPIACLYEKGKNVSWMVLGAPGVHLIPYAAGCIDKGLRNAETWLLSLHVKSFKKIITLRTNLEVPE